MDRERIDAALVARLVAAQFPQWGGRAVRPVEEDGWDNRTFRLGDTVVADPATAADPAPPDRHQQNRSDEEVRP